MLESINLKEEYKVENNKVYAVIPETGRKRIVDACCVRVELAKEDAELVQRKEQLEQELQTITKQLASNKKLDNQIAALGYCKIDLPIYKKIDGVVIYDTKTQKPIIESYTHQSDCPSRRK